MTKFSIHHGIEFEGKIIKKEDLAKHNIFRLNIPLYNSVDPYEGELAMVSKIWTYEELCELDDELTGLTDDIEIDIDSFCLYGYINRDGKEIAKPIYKDVFPPVNGIIVVETAFNNLFNWLDCEGNIISKKNYKSVFHFSNDRAMYSDFGKKDNFLKREDGKPLDEDGYHDINSFTEGRAAVLRYANSLWEFIDKDNNQITGPEFKEAKQMINGMAAVMNEKNLWGYINTDGELVIDFQYKAAYIFMIDTAVVLKDNKFLLINKKNEIIKELKNEELTNFGEDFIYGDKINKGFAISESEGKEVFIYIDLEEKYKTIPLVYHSSSSKSEYDFKSPNYVTTDAVSDFEQKEISEFVNVSVAYEKSGYVEFSDEIISFDFRKFDYYDIEEECFSYIKIEADKTRLIRAKKKYGFSITSESVNFEKWFDTEEELDEYISKYGKFFNKNSKRKVYIRS